MARTKAVLGSGARLTDYLSASLLARVYPAELVHELLNQYGCNTQRKRSFPAAQIKGSQIKGSQIKGSQIKGSQIKGSQIKGSQIKHKSRGQVFHYYIKPELFPAHLYP